MNCTKFINIILIIVVRFNVKPKLTSKFIFSNDLENEDISYGRLSLPYINKTVYLKLIYICLL